MLYGIATVLFILWIIGLLLKIGGGLIHLLLVVAIIVILVRVIQGKKPVG